MSHSKRNTSLAFFTAHERSQLRSSWGSQATRLNRDSFLPFGSCQLCLLPASDPVACSGYSVRADTSSTTEATKTITVSSVPASEATPNHSKSRPRPRCHIFCRECAIANLLAQKQELKRLERRAAATRLETEESERLEDEAAQARAVEEFERVQAGLNVKLSAMPTGGNSERRIVGREGGKVIVEEVDKMTALEGGKIGKGVDNGSNKRKFSIDEAELLRVAEDDRSKARKLLSDEREAARTAVPSFWLPAASSAVAQQQEGGSKNIGKDGNTKKATPTCPGGTPSTSHATSLKSLTAVRFTEETAGPTEAGGVAETTSEEMSKSQTGAIRTCPSCSRALSNASRAVLAKPCGHVLCGPCVDKFMLGGHGGKEAHAWDDEEEEEEEEGRNTVRCFVCSEDVTPNVKLAKKEKKKKKSKADNGEDDEKERGLWDIDCEGTGFAGGGKNLVKREGVVFQC